MKDYKSLFTKVGLSATCYQKHPENSQHVQKTLYQSRVSKNTITGLFTKTICNLEWLLDLCSVWVESISSVCVP